MRTISCLAAIAFVTGHVWAADDAAERGAKMFVAVGCYQCHGYQGQGGAAGPRLAPDTLPYDAFSSFIRTTDRIMPPYTAHVLPEADLKDIHAYLSTIPEPPPRNQIPLLGGK
ncbi:MAG: cytochrome c [Rhodobacteraceae bacterium]|nr:cytochrome c [Paracoccaceae bacterium]